MFLEILAFGWVLREGTSWTQFIGANFELFIEYNNSMWGQENFRSFPKLQELKIYVLKPNFADLGFGEELSIPLHGKISKCVAIAIYVKKQSSKRSSM